MSDNESSAAHSDLSDCSDLDAEEHSYGDDQYSDTQDAERQEEESSHFEMEFEVREVNDTLRDREEHFRHLLKEDEAIAAVPEDKRTTLDVLSKYEKARVLGVRAVQLGKSAPTYADIAPAVLTTLNALQIAEEELRQRVIPFTLRRFLPDGRYEDWHLRELHLFP
jgi:DNA-directed RNA polymerases I, II, and III subunit RPABC2